MDMMRFQSNVEDWMLRVFGKEVLADKKERVHRFMEEAIELAQSLEYTYEEMQKMINYVYGREIGDPHQEVGGVLHCLAALCTATDIDMDKASIDILQYCEERSEKIRQKHSQKPNSIASNKNYGDQHPNL